MRFHVVCIEIVAVVCGDNRNALCLGQFQKLVINDALLFQAVVLQLKIVVPVKELAVAADHLPGSVHVAGENSLRHCALQAGREAGDALGVVFEHIPVHAGLVEEAFLPSCRHDFDKVVVAVGIAGQQDKMIAAPGHFAGGVKAVLAHVDFAAEDGLDAVFRTRLLKLGGSEHVAVIGYGAGIHAVVLGLGAEIAKAYGPVQQAVFSVAVKVDKV